MQPPIPEPRPSPSNEPKHNSRELREWLGLMPADLLIYAALLIGGALYFINNVPFEIGVSMVALALASASCAIGMKPDDQISAAANAAKKYSYPICVLILLGILWVNFSIWNAM